MLRVHSALVLSALLALASCGKLKNDSADGSTPPQGTGAAGSSGSPGNDGAAGNAVSDAAADRPKDDGAGGNTDATAQVDCGAVHLLPPIIAVVDAVTGAPICDPIFKIALRDGGESAIGGTPYLCGQSVNDTYLYDCPAAPADGGVAPCAFAVGTNPSIGSSLEVSKAGYELIVVPVTHGETGCVPYVPASHPIVKLHPLADAATDGG